MICVTGATGFLGRHLLRRLLAAGEAVRCLARPGSPGMDWLRDQPVEVATVSLRRAEAMAAAMTGARQLIHLAAPVREARDTAMRDWCRTATSCLVEAARTARVERVLMVSPLGSGPEAGFPFLRACDAAEETLRASGVPFVILQSSVMFGDGDRLLSGVIRQLARMGVVVVPGTGQSMLQPIWVGDVASCLLRSLREEAVLDRTLPVGGPQHLTFEGIADQVAQMANLPLVKLHLGRRGLGWLSRLLEGLGRSPFPAYRHLELLDAGSVTAPEAVWRTFGFQPMPLNEGLAYRLRSRPEPGRPRREAGAPQGNRGRAPRSGRRGPRA
jgi:uncharacterized protein YbjT (DUF2867 family)